MRPIRSALVSAGCALAVLAGLAGVSAVVAQENLRATIGEAPPSGAPTTCPPLNRIEANMTLQELQRLCPGGPEPGDDAESVWIAIQSSHSPAVFRQFIQKFPGSIYAGFAEARLQELEGAPAEPTPPRQVQAVYCHVDDVRPPDAWLALRTEPSSRSGRRLARLPAGTRIEMLGPQSGDWVQVKTDDGTVGWVSWATRRWIAC